MIASVCQTEKGKKHWRTDTVVFQMDFLTKCRSQRKKD
ncbi:hypothetical protein EC990672_3150 [Escherichia coli 99.0672]|uniref:Uncharacterized protein n=1 Tax=Escherichia coli str. K-12 substr. MG1655 TaxID=511145 RepID=A0A223DQT7_ECOLI|nr:hypothetical protein ECRM13516_5584 [Escherichia coli O145:H28 str. RM13516]AHY68369.1 hypothetical protein ECRM12761_27260 [Escherichia coli O145:H28 str. RM12761]ASS85349.1 hypothetical protein [Escherichia coli str. K-12 substr. MG1655]EGD68163.1 hypothetical protein ECF_01705 [Escherichia coli O157:H7 str. 1125]EKW81775.1 hypothetical protein EC990672_3150 [Escherichia coli 99.0672]EOY68735.1 hypothetical protein H207_4711 [Klebsiella pneumoniae UHKPC40]EOZ18270.1 hypothetical protein 